MQASDAPNAFPAGLVIALAFVGVALTFGLIIVVARARRSAVAAATVAFAADASVRIPFTTGYWQGMGLFPWMSRSTLSPWMRIGLDGVEIHVLQTTQAGFGDISGVDVRSLFGRSEILVELRGQGKRFGGVVASPAHLTAALKALDGRAPLSDRARAALNRPA